MIRLAILLCCRAVLTLACVALGFAQAEVTGVVRAESQQVLVPTFVFDATLMRVFPPNANGDYDFSKAEVRGLTAKDFHLFEDGREQKIQNVGIKEDRRAICVRDNMGGYNELSDAPRGLWSTPESSYRPGDVEHYYVVSYVPPKSEIDSCHRIEVRVDRRNSYVFARSQYCNTEHSASDPLKGTQISHHMEEFAASAERGKVPLSATANFFYRAKGDALVSVALEFPWEKLKREWVPRDLNGQYSIQATITTLGMVYRKDGTLATRFSAFGCCSSDEPNFIRGPRQGRPAPEMDPISIPTRYETQLDLPPGDYNIELVISDGAKYGNSKVELTIPPFDREQLSISSIMLCKRFRDAMVAEKEEKAANLAPDYLPLVSNGVQFIPTADTRFRRREPLFAYIEVYEPLTSSPPTVTLRMEIFDAVTGELKVDTGKRNATSWIKPGNPVIAIAEQVAVDKLSRGNYRIEIQASDSNGATTGRTTVFTVE